jgi:1,2-phenylacetyl-CoA epoxidase PaaB subunit
MQRKMISKKTELGADTGGTSKWFEVFARRDSGEALTHVGAVQAPNTELAKARAWYVYDHHKWKEMCLVETSSVIPVTADGLGLPIKVV